MKLSKSKVFYIFLAAYFLLFCAVQFIRKQPSTDSMEAILWGELLDFGTNKHPPLSGWIIGGFFNLFGQNEHVAYFLDTACIVIGFVFTYKLAKFFLPKEKAICATMIMPVCFYYTYTLFLDNFNCNTVSIALFPMIAYFYYKSVRKNKLWDWILFGITSALGALNKYQVIFLLFPLLIHLIVFERKQFKQKGMYIAIFCGLLLLLPHILWLKAHDFFSFAYLANQAGENPEEAAVPIFSLVRIFHPIKFTADQILATLPCVGAYLLLAKQAKNIKFNTDENNKSDKAFVLLIATGIVLSQDLMGVLTGAYLHGIWGSIMVGFTGIALFYFFPIKFNEKSFSFFVKVSYSLMILWSIALVVFVLLQTRNRITFPPEKIITYLNEQWSKQTDNAPLKYVAGTIGYISPFRIFDKTHPHVILETYGYKNPWEDHKDILESGALIISNEEDTVDKKVRETITELPEDYEYVQQEYEYDIVNILGQGKKFQLYYVVIPPQKND